MEQINKVLLPAEENELPSDKELAARVLSMIADQAGRAKELLGSHTLAEVQPIFDNLLEYVNLLKLVNDRAKTVCNTLISIMQYSYYQAR
jgi:hypothetical protein